VDRQRWALLAGTGAALAACVVAAVLPSHGTAGDVERELREE